jgi:RNA polymerase sigma-70 factor (ECF subfamily)
MPAARFQTTNWSLVFAAGGSPDALNDLCARYWTPVYAYVRRCGLDRADAEDLTQAFFGRMLEHRDLEQADPRRGKFRSFLLGALKHFLSNERDRARAKKRGGDVVHVEIDVATADDRLTPDQVFNKQWALTVLERAMRELREAGEPEHLMPFLTGDESYAALAAERKTSEGALRVAVHRLRRKFRDRLRRIVEETVAERAGVDDEIRFLIAAVSAPP